MGEIPQVSHTYAYLNTAYPCLNENHLAPSLGLRYEMDELPFSVKPEKKVDIREVMALYRETYEGTDFDMTRGIKLARAANKEHPADTIVSPLALPILNTPAHT